MLSAKGEEPPYDKSEESLEYKALDKDLTDLLISPPSFNPETLNSPTSDPLALNDNDLLPLPEIEPTSESSKILKENTENNLPSTTGCSSTPDAPATTPLVQQPNANPEIVNDLPDLFDDNYPAFLKTIARKDNISFNTVIQEHNEDITKSKYKIIILPTSIDLDESNPYIQNIIDNLPNSSEIIHKERSLNSSAQGQPNQSFIEPINSSSGLYFDYLGKLRINNIELNIVIPVDISHFKPHIDNIKSALSVTEELCKQTRIIEITSTCYNNLKPLIVRFQDMSRELTSISHLIDNRTKRSAWISGAGTILKKIFGTLDENDGLQYDEAIKTLQLNEKKLASLIKENILVTTSVLTQYNATLSKIVENEANSKEAIDKLSANIRNITEMTNGLQIQASVNEVINALETSILTLSFQLEDIINAILFSSQNILHPAIATPTQLHKELADNYRHLPSDLELPVPLDIKSIHIILSISKLVCYYASNKVIFILQVPMVKTQEYVLFHNIALPTPHNTSNPNSFSLILPDYKYLAMTKDKSFYCTFNSLEICKTVTPGNYICDIENVYSTEAKPICESELLTKVISVKPSQCHTKTLIGKVNIWKPLINNKWIFVQSKPNKISIDCLNNRLQETTISGTGILTIPKHCIAYCKSTTLIPKHNTFNITSPIRHFPDFNLINDSCCIINLVYKNVSAILPVKLNNIDLDDLHTDYNDKIKSILKNLEPIVDPPTPHIVTYGTHYSVVTMAIVIFILIFLNYLVYKKICKRYNRSRRNRTNICKTSSQPEPDLEMTNRPTDCEDSTPNM
ncbi:hypothetical protein HF086_014894, partial [Spodoptera exigua]